MSKILMLMTTSNLLGPKRRAENPDLSSDKRDQMYGHIDGIATGEVGTLLDRFSDRFGSELDREIIVLRKKQQKKCVISNLL